ncbi:MAG: cytoplasmic protein [Deltaproteobacteria bacterium]|nr:cytoplasmic protein [Deltaproteobacteria bacterium]
MSLAQAASAPDPTVTDGDKYKVLLENEHVRVLSYTDAPGDRTQPHRHPAFVLHALGPFKRKLTFPDGRTAIREFQGGEVFYSAGEVHVGENVGETPTRVLIVELKGAAMPRP